MECQEWLTLLGFLFAERYHSCLKSQASAESYYSNYRLLHVVSLSGHDALFLSYRSSPSLSLINEIVGDFKGMLIITLIS